MLSCCAALQTLASMSLVGSLAWLRASKSLPALRRSLSSAGRMSMRRSFATQMVAHGRPMVGSATATHSRAWFEAGKFAGQRQASGGADTDVAEAKAFLLRLRYSPEVAEGIINALKSSGALLPTLYAMAGAWEVGGDAGLAALAKAVELELAAQSGRKVVRFRVKVPHARVEFECQGLEGMTLRDVTESGEEMGGELLSEYIECACSGVMACSTCHVIVDPHSFALVGPPDDAEEDMLDLAFGTCERSRLGCQVRLHASMHDKLVVAIPESAHNLMDHIPFPDR